MQPLTSSEKVAVIAKYIGNLNPIEFDILEHMQIVVKNNWKFSVKETAWVDKVCGRIDRLYIKTGVKI